eukprot:5903053-Pyramimonas_sp.AAC.1
MRTKPLEPSVELLKGQRSVTGVCRVDPIRHGDGATAASGGACCGAARRVRVVPKWTRDGMRTQPL